MKNQDDGTLSLFDDFPPAFVPPAAPAKKARGKRKAAELKVEVSGTHADEVKPAPAAPAVVTEAAAPASNALQKIPASHEPEPSSAESATTSNDGV